MIFRITLMALAGLIITYDASASVWCAKPTGKVFVRNACLKSEKTLDLLSLGLQGPQGAPGAIGPQGAQGAIGPQGAQGTSGVVNTITFTNSLSATEIPSVPDLVYAFAGTPAVVTVSSQQQKLTGAGMITIGSQVAITGRAVIGLCYQRQPIQVGILPIFDTLHLLQDAAFFNLNTAPFEQVTTTVVGSKTDLPAGAYNVGICYVNNTGEVWNYNDYAQGWILLTN